MKHKEFETFGFTVTTHAIYRFIERNETIFEDQLTLQEEFRRLFEGAKPNGYKGDIVYWRNGDWVFPADHRKSRIATCYIAGKDDKQV